MGRGELRNTGAESENSVPNVPAGDRQAEMVVFSGEQEYKNRRRSGIGMKNAMGFFAVLALLIPGSVLAQGYTIQSPGGPPTYVTPQFGGGYVIQAPGQAPSYLTPSFGGGYVHQAPGQPPTYIQPNSIGSGYTIQSPGQPPTYINPY